MVASQVIPGTKPLAFLLLGLEASFPAGTQAAIDILASLGNGQEEILEVLLSKGLVLQALRWPLVTVVDV